MGKSPGKWIKTVLFGKKTTRSNASKGRDASKSSNEKEALVSAKVPTAGLVVSSPLISQSDPMPNRKIGENSELEQSNSESVVALGDHSADTQGTTTSDVSNVQDRIRQEQAATKAQAAFRGYLARRAFRALMGIIRLQALVRGHLVRRQAVATLRCVQGIVKFQRLVREQKDSKLSKSCGTHKSICLEKLVANSFISKLSASSSNAKPLCLQYNMGESNSAWSWLERWSKIRVWEPPPQQPKKIVDSKSNSKPKRIVRKTSAPKVDSGSIRSTSASEKPKRNMRKVLAHPVDLAQESSQNELEKVKRNLRKVSNSTNETSDINGVETEKPKRVPRKTSCSTAPDVLGTSMCEPAENEKLKPTPIRKAPGSKSVSGDQVEAEGEVAEKSLGLIPSDVPDQDIIVESAEKMKKDALEAAFKQPEEESTPNSLLDNKIVCVSDDVHPALDSSPLENCEKSEKTHIENGKLILNTDQSNEHQNTNKRRASLPAKQELPETGLQNTPKLPSYMAATESVKAKLRAQGPPISSPDVTDQNGLARRLSLPSPINGKMSSLSPRTQRPQANGKGMIKNNRSILSSKDANEKVSQGEWKR